MSDDGLHLSSGKFFAGDDPAWASPYFDDSQWRPVKIPGSWQAQGLQPLNYMGWYRTHFTWPGLRVAEEGLAVYLGAIGDADEVFLNGLKLGGEGRIGEELVETPHTRRLYKIPGGLMKYNADNVLAIRVMNTYIYGGLLDSPIIVGGYKDLLLLKKEAETGRRNMEIVFITFFVVFLLIYLFLYVTGIRETEYALFGLLVFLYFLSYLFTSLIFYETGLKTHAVEKGMLALAALLPANLLAFLVVACRRSFSWAMKVLISLFVVIAACFAVARDYRTYALLTDLWALAASVAALAAFFIVINAFSRRVHESGYILLGLMCLFTGILVEALQLTGLFHLRDFFGESASVLSVPFMALCVLFALSARFVRMAESNKALSVRILTANEEERKRLARDLHDGVGQSLLSLKLRLQMMEAKNMAAGPGRREDFGNLISNVSSSIEELRNVAMDIRPSFLEDTDIVEAVRWYGSHFQEKTGIKVSVIGETSPMDLSTTIKDNLYRICQEALGNVYKHSECERVELAFSYKVNVLCLEIRDNGRGLDSGSTDNKRKGLGLQTMKERAALMGGRCELKSAPSKGTTVQVEVPLV